MTFTLKIDMGNAAFDEMPEAELLRIMAALLPYVAQGYRGAAVFDINGNRVGKWTITGKRREG